MNSKSHYFMVEINKINKIDTENLFDLKNEKIEENISSMLQNVIEFDDDSPLEDSSLNVDEPLNYSNLEEEMSANSCPNPESINQEIVSLEGSVLSKSMDSINENSLTKYEKNNKSVEVNVDNSNSESLSINLNASQEFLEDQKFKNNSRSKSPKNRSFSLIKFDSSYTSDNSFADDIKKIPSAFKCPKSTFFAQNKNKDKEKTKENTNFLLTKNLKIEKNPKEKESKNSSILQNSKNVSTQDQLISFNSDVEGCGSIHTTNSNILGQNLFSNSNSINIIPSKFSSNKHLNNPNSSNINSSYNLNSTNQSYKKYSHFLPDAMSKDQNLSSLSYNQ